MTKPKTMLVNIPFSGFYNSIWSDEIDREEQEHINYAVHGKDRDNDLSEHLHPEPLQLDEAELSEIYLRATQYGWAYNAIAQDYVASFNAYWSAEIGFPLRLAFESMTSPREYNFATDRIFCDVPISVIHKLFAVSRADKHETLHASIKDRFTSCSGFISHYSNDLNDWLEKPLCNWDHNELGTLLIAVMALRGSPDALRDYQWEWYLCEGMSESSVFYKAWSDAVDWQKVGELCAYERAEKLDALRDTDPDTYALLTNDADSVHYRCPLTPDLFA